MAEKMIINAVMNRKADFYEPKKCVVEKVIDVYETEFKKMLEKPLERNYYLAPYRSLMGFYDNAYHCILFVDQNSSDGLLVNSEGSDYARYSQFIPNAKDIILMRERSLALDDLKTHMDCCIDKWLKQHANEDKFSISLTDLIDDSNVTELFVNYASEALCSDPRIETCELTHNTIDVTKRELTETKLYCPLTFQIEPEENEDYGDLTKVDSANFIYYDDEINEIISKEFEHDEDEREHGLNAYTRSDYLAKKVYSIFPSVETRDGDLYSVVTIRSYGELDKADLTELTEAIEGQLADGYGEHFEQQSIRLGDDEVYISFWNSDDDYFLKPESEVFPEQKLEQTMGGLN